MSKTEVGHSVSSHSLAPPKMVEKLLKLLQSITSQTEKAVASLPQGALRQKEERTLDMFYHLASQLKGESSGSPTTGLVASGYQNLAVFLFNKRKFKEAHALAGNSVQLFDAFKDLGRSWNCRLLQVRSLLGFTKNESDHGVAYARLKDAVHFMEELSVVMESEWSQHVQESELFSYNSLVEQDYSAVKSNNISKKRTVLGINNKSAHASDEGSSTQSLRDSTTLAMKDLASHRLSLLVELARARTRMALYLRQAYLDTTDSSTLPEKDTPKSGETGLPIAESPATFATSLWSATSSWAKVLLDPLFQAITQEWRLAEFKGKINCIIGVEEAAKIFEHLENVAHSSLSIAKQTLKFHVDLFEHLELYPQLLATLKLLLGTLPVREQDTPSALEKALLHLQIQSVYSRLGRLPSASKYLYLSFDSLAIVYPQLALGLQKKVNKEDEVEQPKGAKASKGRKTASQNVRNQNASSNSIRQLVWRGEVILESIVNNDGLSAEIAEPQSTTTKLLLAPSSSAALDWSVFCRQRWILAFASHLVHRVAASATASKHLSVIESNAFPSPLALSHTLAEGLTCAHTLMGRLSSLQAEIPIHLKRLASAASLAGDIALIRSEIALFINVSKTGSQLATAIRLGKQGLSAWVALLRKVTESSQGINREDAPISNAHAGETEAHSGSALSFLSHTGGRVGDTWQQALNETGLSEGLASLWLATKGTGRALSHLATLFEAAGQPRTAAYFLNQCNELSVQARAPALAASCALAQGKLESARGRVDKAREHISRAWSALSTSEEDLCENGSTSIQRRNENTEEIKEVCDVEGVEDEKYALWSQDWSNEHATSAALWPSVKAEVLATDSALRLATVTQESLREDDSFTGSGLDDLREQFENLSLSDSKPGQLSNALEIKAKTVAHQIQTVMKSVCNILHRWVLVRDIEKEIATAISNSKIESLLLPDVEDDDESLVPVSEVLAISMQSRVDAIWLDAYISSKDSQSSGLPDWAKAWQCTESNKGVPSRAKASTKSTSNSLETDDQEELDARAELIALTDDLIQDMDENDCGELDESDELEDPTIDVKNILYAPRLLSASLAVAPTPAIRCEAYLVRAKWAATTARYYLRTIHSAHLHSSNIEVVILQSQLLNVNLSLSMFKGVWLSSEKAWNTLVVAGTAIPSRLAAKAALLGLEAVSMFRYCLILRRKLEIQLSTLHGNGIEKASTSKGRVRSRVSTRGETQNNAFSLSDVPFDIATFGNSHSARSLNSFAVAVLHHLGIGLSFRHEKMIVCENLASNLKQSILSLQNQKAHAAQIEVMAKQLQSTQSQMKALAFAPSLSVEIESFLPNSISSSAHASALPLGVAHIAVSFSSSKSHLLVSRMVRLPQKCGTNSFVRAHTLSFSLELFPSHMITETLSELQKEIALSHTAALTVSQTISKSEVDIAEQKAKWWCNRFDIDRRILRHLAKIEANVFGPFAGILRGVFVSEESFGKQEKSFGHLVRLEAHRLACYAEELKKDIYEFANSSKALDEDVDNENLLHQSFLFESVLNGLLTSPLLFHSLHGYLEDYCTFESLFKDECKDGSEFDNSDLSLCQKVPDLVEDLLSEIRYSESCTPLECVAAFTLGVLPDPLCSVEKLSRILLDKVEMGNVSSTARSFTKALLEKISCAEEKSRSLTHLYAVSVAKLTFSLVRSSVELSKVCQNMPEAILPPVQSLPVILCIGKDLQDVPWESLPVLRQMEVVLPPEAVRAASNPRDPSVLSSSRNGTQSFAEHCLSPCLLAEAIAPQRVTRSPSLWNTLILSEHKLGLYRPLRKLVSSEQEDFEAKTIQVQSTSADIDESYLGKILQENLETYDGAPPVLSGFQPQKGFYILNPGKDLPNTQKALEPFFTKELSEMKWRGIVGAPLSILDFAKETNKNDLLVYCGHNGGEQYVSYDEVCRMRGGAVIWLMGCSSGLLQCVSSNSNYDPTGIAMAHLLSGAPSVVANLWEVSDRDADKITLAMLESMTGHPVSIKSHGKVPKSFHEAERNQGDVDVAVAAFRSCCRLPYVNGAALVNFGIPVRFESTKNGDQTELELPRKVLTFEPEEVKANSAVENDVSQVSTKEARSRRTRTTVEVEETPSDHPIVANTRPRTRASAR